MKIHILLSFLLHNYTASNGINRHQLKQLPNCANVDNLELKMPLKSLKLITKIGGAGEKAT